MKRILAFLCAIVMVCTVLTSCDNRPVFTIFNWEDYINPEVLEAFEKEHPDVRVVYENFSENEDMYTKLKNGNGNYDVLIPSDYMIEKLIKENLLAEIDYNNVPNYKYISDYCKGLDFDPQNKYTAPYMWGTLGIIYNKNVVKEDKITWNVLFGDKYKVIMMKSIRDALGAALVASGYSLNTGKQSEINVAKDLLIKQKGQSNFYGYAFDEIKDKMVRGEADAALIYSGDAVYAMKQNPDLAYAVPDGSNKWFDAMVIPKSSKNKKLAEEFINFMCDTQNAKKNSDYIGYSTAQGESAKLIEQETGIKYPVADLDRTEVFRNPDDGVLDMYNKAWTSIFA